MSIEGSLRGLLFQSFLKLPLRGLVLCFYLYNQLYLLFNISIVTLFYQTLATVPELYSKL